MESEPNLNPPSDEKLEQYLCPTMEDLTNHRETMIQFISQLHRETANALEKLEKNLKAAEEKIVQLGAVAPRSQRTFKRTSPLERRAPLCRECNKAHSMIDCPALSIMKKKEILQKLNKCFNCLKKHMGECHAPQCNQSHHPALHI